MGRIAVRLFVSLVIAALLILWLTKQGFEVLPNLEEIESVTAWWGVPLYSLLFSLFHVLRAWRWIFLLRPFAKVPAGTMMEVAFTGFVAIQMMPLRTGEVARPYLLDRYAGISKSALFGTIAIERVVDGLIVSWLLTAALLTIPATGSSLVWGLRLTPLLLFSVALVVLVAFYFRPATVRRMLEGMCRLLSKRFAELAIGVLERFHAGLAALPNHRNFWAFVVLTVVYWLINAMAFFLLARSCGLPLPFLGALAGMGCLAVGILLPAGPGYFGNFQVAVLTAMGLFVSLDHAGREIAVFVFLLYALQTGLAMVFGAISGLKLSRRPVQKRERGAVSAGPAVSGNEIG